MGVQTVVAIDCDPPASDPGIIDYGISAEDRPIIYVNHDDSTSVVLSFDTLAALIEWLDDLSDTATNELAAQQRERSGSSDYSESPRYNELRYSDLEAAGKAIAGAGLSLDDIRESLLEDGAS